MALEKLEGAITFTAAQTVAIVEATGPSATVTVAAASSTYYLTSNASLLSAVVNALNDDATLGGSYSLSLDDDTDAATGKATISATGVGANFSVTWNTTALRDALGWAANLSGATSYQAPAQARYLFLPNCGRSNPMAPNPTALTQDMGVEESDYTITVAPSGASKRVGYNRRLTEQIEWSWLKAQKTWIQHETITNESMQRFYRDVIAIGRAFRYHPDRASDGICFEWAAREGQFHPTPVAPTWVGSLSGWVLRIPVVGQSGSASGLILVSGTGTITEAADTLAATIETVVSGTATMTEADDTVAATGFLLPALSCWLISDAGVTLVGSKVSQWDDQSGNGKNVVQGTDANRPERVNSVVDGYPVLRFLSGGTAKYLTWSAGPGGTAELTMVVVWKQVAKTGTYQLILYGANTDAYLGYSNDNPTVEDNGATSWGTASTAGQVYAARWSRDHAIPRRYIEVGDGTELDAASGSTNGSLTHIGYTTAAFFLESDLVELRVYNSRLTSAQWTALYNELKSRYPSIS